MFNLFKKKKQPTICAPSPGDAIQLSDVNDPVFSEEMMGKGGAVIPSSDTVVSPINGRVDSIFPTKHAVCLTSEDGMEILIHIGIDTVKLNGEHFEIKCVEGSNVKIGDPLVQFDKSAIESAGYDTVVITIVTNTDDYKNITAIAGPIKAGDTQITLEK